MKVDLEPGTYVVAVSGGVDSAVLLNLLCNKLPISKEAPWKLVVAHFDHGIRGNSADDAEFVRNLAKKLDLVFETKRENLGPNASEALARERRYAFLEAVAAKHQAKAIITAHHKDDVIETAIINLLRGTGRKGLSSLRSGAVIRPLLTITKKEILEYAAQRNLEWREDHTNSDQKYLRNKIRRQLAESDPQAQQRFYELIMKAAQSNDEIDGLLANVLSRYTKDSVMDRNLFISLPYAVSTELLAEWLRKSGCEFDRKTISRLVIAAKTAQPSTAHDIDKTHCLHVVSKQISLRARSSV